MKTISESAAVRAKAAHDLQGVEWETTGFPISSQNLFTLKQCTVILLCIDNYWDSLYSHNILVSHDLNSLFT